MSRTRRTSPDFVKRGAREGHGAMTCSGGRRCVWCSKSLRISVIRGTLHATEDIVAYLNDQPEPEAPTGGVDDWGCWGTAIGADPDCRCESCSEMWQALDPRATYCAACGSSDCRMD